MADEIEVRPRDDDPPLFRARVSAAIAPMHEEPRVASQQVSQQLAGYAVDAMDVEGEWIRARGADGYEGWIHSGFLEEGASPPEPLAGPVSLGCTTERDGGSRRALPLRAILRPDERVVAGEALKAAKLQERFPLEPDAIAKSAREFFRGTSYIWGGVTPWGADCSGLVQSVFALHGRMLGIALGPNEMVHLALGRGGYSCERLDANDPYIAKLRDRFVSARRLL
jgi:cell wall-associated NlpC family hydrolase